ncbi:unnamed protein product [Calicophoron daubneyi]|uniref:Uncharacterized protein n=1 Tax=Calicophoron daubneyi TaxID=300641 RepID=A0AAV2T5I5_CALDB
MDGRVGVSFPLLTLIFQEELDAVISRFQTSRSDALLEALSLAVTSTASSTADLVPLLYWPPRRRRRDPAIVRIVEMIGDGQVLYEKTVNILREECTRAAAVASAVDMTPPSREPSIPTKRRRRLDSSSSSGGREKSSHSISNSQSFTAPLIFLPNASAVASVNLCTLRFDLLMSLNEAKVDRLCVPDRIHRFVWCLDACVRNRRIDQRHASGLAYHLTIQRQRCSAKIASNVDRDDTHHKRGNSSSSSATGSRLKGSKSSVASGSKIGHKRTGSEERTDEEEEGSDSEHAQKDLEKTLLEKDVHMACRDPWVMYTICTSLIRYTLNGLYEDKLPRDIPEVSLLIHFLMLGCGDDFAPLPSAGSHTKDRPGSKRAAHSSPSPEDEGATQKNPSNALLNHILPAVAQLHVLTWRAQVAEEILASSNNLWPNMAVCSQVGSSTPTTPTAPSSGVRRPSTSNVHESRDIPPPPPALLKQITEATQSTTISVPPDYFVHPIGYLILQYHALFALERNELALLRSLLKAAAGITQQQARASRKSVASKHGSSSPTSSPSATTHPPVPFRWRPDVLQALVLGIALLPPSAAAFIESGRNVHRTDGSAPSTINDDGTHIDSNSSDTSGPRHSGPAQPGGKSGDGIPSSSGCLGSGKSGSSTGHASNLLSSNTIMITRSELAALLRASLTLTSDLHLLALAQIALLVPGPSPPSSISSSAATSLPPTLAEGQLEIVSPTPTLSERERLLNTLARHCTTSTNTEAQASTSDTNPSTPQVTAPSGASSNPSSNIFKSSDPRVLLALEAVRKEVEKGLSTISLPLTPTNLAGPKSVPYSQPTPYIGGGQSSRYTGFQVPTQPDVWPGATPRSPNALGKYARPPVDGPRSASAYSTTRFDFKTTSNAPGSSYYPSLGSGSQLPIGTPLTNPGLMGATPNVGNYGLGQAAIPRTPRRPSTPPREFRPSSPPPGSSSLGLGSFNMPTFNSDYTSCPSPSVHRTSVGNGGNSALRGYPRPRSPSPKDR